MSIFLLFFHYFTLDLVVDKSLQPLRLVKWKGKEGEVFD
jgi:hypothetical protein